jgi:NADH-quinone oxidoreductase subunit C
VTPEEIGERLVGALTGAGIEPADGYSVSAGGRYGRACVDVPPHAWVAAARMARDALGLGFFDWLAGVDEGAQGFGVVLHLWSLPGRYGALLRTSVPRAEPVLATLTDVFPRASWPEREAAEMFGLRFEGHPNPGKLLLPDEFEGHPLRKDFILAARVAKAWPGAKEPGESDTGAPSRRRVRPPGVPDPNEWGPEAGRLPPEDAARADRTARRAARAPRPATPAPDAERPPPAARPARPPRPAPAVRSDPDAARSAPPPAGSAEGPAADAARPESGAERPARPSRSASAEGRGADAEGQRADGERSEAEGGEV